MTHLHAQSVDFFVTFTIDYEKGLFIRSIYFTTLLCHVFYSYIIQIT